MKTMSRVTLCVALLSALVARPAGAADCHVATAGKRFACVASSSEIPTFDVAFDAAGRKAFASGAVLDCFCTSLGGLAKPRIEAGNGMTCVSHLSGGALLSLSMRVQSGKLTQGTRAVSALLGRDVNAFACEPFDP